MDEDDKDDWFPIVGFPEDTEMSKEDKDDKSKTAAGSKAEREAVPPKRSAADILRQLQKVPK